MHALGVLMPGSQPFRERQTVKALLFEADSSSFPAQHAYGSHGIPSQIFGYSRLLRRACQAFFFFAVVLSIAFLLLCTHIRRFKWGKEVRGGPQTRRLASSSEEKEGKDGDSRARESCSVLEEVVSSHETEEGVPQTSQQPQAAPSGAVAEQEKAKRKLERSGEEAESAVEQTKKARAEPLPSPTSASSDEKKEEDAFVVVEQAVAAAIDSVGSQVERWGKEFSEELLYSFLPEMSPKTPPDSDESEGPVSVEQNLQLLFQAAQQLQGEHQPTASSSSSKEPVSPHMVGDSSDLAQVLATPSATGTFSPEGSMGSAPPTSSVQLVTHPYYRLPDVPAEVTAQLKMFDGLAPFAYTLQPTNLQSKLLDVRSVFGRTRLDLSDLSVLTVTAQMLLHYASKWFPEQLEGPSPSQVIEPAARRLLVADALWSMCRVVGPKMNAAQWWGRLMKHLAIPESVVSRSVPSGCTDWRPFLRLLRSAMEEYRHGRRPSAPVIVELKRTIFCNPSFHRRFRTSSWDAWREDDAKHGGGLGSS